MNWLGFRNISRDDGALTLTLTDHDDADRSGFNVQAARPLDRGQWILIILLRFICLKKPKY